jgi:DNA-binding transcriptional LysR family regulator
VVPLSSFDPLPLLQRLHAAHPNLRFEMSSLSSEQILEQLANNRINIGVSYLDRLDNERFESHAFSETRMGLLYDQRTFTFGEAPLSWQALIELPLGMLTSGMHFRQSIDHNFHSRGLTRSRCCKPTRCINCYKPCTADSAAQSCRWTAVWKNSPTICVCNRSKTRRPSPRWA